MGSDGVDGILINITLHLHTNRFIILIITKKASVLKK